MRPDIEVILKLMAEGMTTEEHATVMRRYIEGLRVALRARAMLYDEPLVSSESEDLERESAFDEEMRRRAFLSVYEEEGDDASSSYEESATLT